MSRQRWREDVRWGVPRRARALLRRRCPAWKFEEVDGDLKEVYANVLATRGRRWAVALYWKEVLLFCLWYARHRTTDYEQAGGPVMFANYFKTTLRNLRKQGGYTAINVLGLAIGMGACLFLVLTSQYIFSYDTSHQNADRIYRLTDEIRTASGDLIHAAISPPTWGPALADENPEIEHFTRFAFRGHGVAYEDKWFSESIAYVDSAIFDIFTYPFATGDPETALATPNSIVLTAPMAEKYFGQEDPLGKTLVVDGEASYQVTGVLKKLPRNVSFSFNSLASFSTLTEQSFPLLNSWTAHNIYTYVLLSETATAADVESRFSTFLTTYVDEEALDRYTPHLQYFPDIYLHSDLFAEHGDTLEIAYLYIFSAIAFLILLIACINFMNLATARAATRAQEVGMRKVLGAGRGQLLRQFLSEAVILALLALVVAMVFAEGAIHWFNGVIDADMTISYTDNILYLGALAAIVLLVGVIAGSYPALYLSSFQPVQVLKGATARGGRGGLLRKGLVVSQFTVTTFLLIGTGVVFDQLGYLKGKDLGYEEEHVAVIGAPAGQSVAQYETIRQELLKQPTVTQVSLASSVPSGNVGMSRFNPEGQFEEGGLLLNHYSVDPAYIDALALTLVAGRNFVEGSGADTLSAYLINEAAVRRFGWTDPVGKTITVQREEEADEVGTVVGVVRDFHFESLHRPIQPLVIRMRPSLYRNFVVRFQTADVSETIATLEAQWRAFDPTRPMNYYFIEDDLADEYETEEIIGDLLRNFTFLTILIACLGLLGLAAFTTLQRTKEIGVRKVLGASVPGIVMLLFRDFFTLVLIAFVVAAPLAYFGLNAWLESFAYRVTPSIEVFLLAGGLVILTAWLTVLYHSVKAALSNPVQSLRYE